MAWNTACPDWERRLTAGAPLVPDLPLNRDEAGRALRIFNRLRLPDVIGQPSMAEAAGPWFTAIVEALFGSYDPLTNRRAIQEYFLCVPKKNAKALALDTLIATPSGFTTMRDIQVGDEVLGDDGVPTRVTTKSPVFINHQCHEMVFSTGEKVVCDAGHLWVTDAHRDRDRKRGTRSKRRLGGGSTPFPTVKTTEQIAASLKVSSGRYVINNHRTSLCAPLDLPDAKLPIPPYALGAWLGDGTCTSAVITAGQQDEDHMVEQLVANGQPAFIRPVRNTCGAASISLTTFGMLGQKLPYRFLTEARRLGILGNKHIPQAYLRASKDQRLRLLQGLMDTDGSISKRGQVCITTIYPRLRDDVCELINSLGLKASSSEHRAMLKGVDHGPYWLIQFWPFSDISVFTMPRKAGKQRPRGAGCNTARSATRQIVDVRPVASVPVQCISVANETKQFLITRSLIPTHNSSNGGALMVVALIVNRRPEGEFLLVAPTKEIADIAFKQASGTIRIDPELAKLFHIQRHIRLITHRRTGAVLQIKAADTDVITGSKALGTMIDETHVFAKRPRAAEVFVELRGALAARPDGFLFQTTTQSKEPPSGVFRAELQMARDVRDGRISLPLLPVIYELPNRLAQDGGWKNRRYWPLVNPNMGRSVDEDFLDREIRKAESQGAVALALIASQHFNVEIGLSLMSDRWAGVEFWERRADPTLTLETLLERSEVVIVGIDGGGLDDLFGLAVLGRDRDTKGWLLWSHAWCHEGVLDRRKTIAARLLDFAAAGELTIVDDELADLSAIVAIVARVKQAGLLGGVAVDPAGLGEFVDAMAEIEVTQDNKLLIGVGQGYRMMNAIKTAERRLASGMLCHSGSSMMAWCVANLRIEPTATAIRATKQNAGDAKIDPAMAMFDAVDLMSANPEPVREPEYQMIFA